ncbi:SusC/RagA family TonB-linked outer membrane protein [Spirosoma validum]|uniref:SusC/RagA family TonB-linked outer membrane protein n=1 Tax=Spirosoma validum TaxID=2771355 RepID=A0A927AY95_9BACT|nr:SusC/RagA family TonB-linked outer membrane protein [Spirosoma validum]MBD2751978.1 SusC/RagA family TonB-linked outer membrane protein [Spirosoma validum]
MMDKSYKMNRFNGFVGQVGVIQPQPLGRKALVSFLSILAMVLLLGNSVAWAQGRTVTGKVTDPTGFGLPGVSVQVKGTQRGTNTDANGAYTIANVPDGATLVMSFIGYATQEVPVGNRATVDVQLVDDTKALQEVVVVGYGTQRVKDATGSVSSLGTKDFNKGVISSPEQMLQGRVAGVQITPSSGEPGAGINVQIRGTSSLRGGNNPLFVIDGVPLDGGSTSDGNPDFGGGTTSARNPLSFLNPADIENISVLKDASAAAIYGSRGANGVVLITTRKGKAGQQSLTFSASGSVATPLKRYNLLTASDFLTGVTAAGGDASVVNKGANTNWQDQILRTGITQTYNLGFGGGNENTRYFFSLGYQDQEGIIKNSGQKRLTGRVNASHELFNDKVVIDLNATTSGVTDTYVLNGDNAGAQGSLIGAALQANPTYPVYNADGTFYQPGGDYRNVAAILAYDNDKGQTNRTLANASVTWKILDGLSVKANFGIDNSTAVRRTALDSRLNNSGFTFALIPNLVTVSIPQDANTKLGGLAYIQNRYRSSQLIEYTANYNKKVGIGNLEALVGFSYQVFQNQGNYLAAANFPFDESQISYIDAIGSANANNRTSYGGGSDNGRNDLQSYFGRAIYNINEKYILTGTLRVDGSSRFGVNNKYGYFPSLAAAWRLSEEAFIPKNIFDDLKLRVNYGVTGNQDFAGGASKIIFNINADGSTTQQNNPNPNLKWEQNTTVGAGIDFTILKGRLGGSVDYFHKSSTNTLFQVFYAQPAPVQYRWVNLPGEIINRGVELSLNFQAVQQKKFGWEVLYNMTFLNNTVKDLGTTVPTGTISGQGLSGAYAQVITSGYPIFTFYMPTFTGYDTEGLGTYANGGASSFQGSPLPKIRLGLTNNFTFGKFNASLFFNGQFGGYIYNNTNNALFLKAPLKSGKNVTYEALNSPESGLNSGSVSTRFLEKSDYIRLTNASVGYRFELPQGGFAKSLSVSVSGQNLLLLTGYTGLNPDVNTVKTYNNIPSLGIDYTPYPTPRTFTLGLNVGF